MDGERRGRERCEKVKPLNDEAKRLVISLLP
jgi:hypothetical protein